MVGLAVLFFMPCMAFGEQATLAAERSPVEMAKEHMRRGRIALEKKQLSDACFEFQSATRVLSNWWVPQLEYVRCARILGDEPEVLLARVDRILSIDERHASLHHLRGILLEDLEKAHDASGAYRRALEIAPWMVEASIGLCRTLFSAGKRGEALTVTLQTLEKRPNDVMLLSQVASIYEEGGRNRELIPVLEKLALVSNRPTAALARLVRAYAAIGDESGRRDAMSRLEKMARLN